MVTFVRSAMLGVEVADPALLSHATLASIVRTVRSLAHLRRASHHHQVEVHACVGDREPIPDAGYKRQERAKRASAPTPSCAVHRV